ncbi:MAG: PAS domain S-box protein, partial [Chloroflexi bacterium]|nr:PAS domain S-box protein [Chloroflexota bacterium]
MSQKKFTIRNEKNRIPTMAILVAICCLLSYYCHWVLGIEGVYSHFFYIPIILAAVWWKSKGLVVPLFLALLLLVSDPPSRFGLDWSFANDLARAALLIVVGVTVSILCERIQKADVSLRQHAENIEKMVEERTEELRETRDYLDNLIRYANAPIIVWNPANEINIFNQAFEKLSGRTAAEMMGQPLDVLFPEDSRADCLQKVEIASKGEYWETMEIPILRRDGEIRIGLWNSANVYSEDGETLIATVAQGQDITKRKQAEEALRESEGRMKLALEGTDLGLWDWDVVSGAITFDDNWPRVLGYTPGEMKFDFTWWERSIHPDTGPVFEAALNDYLEGREKYYELEYQIKNKSGEWRWIWARGICVAYGEQGEPLRMIGTHRDITERVRAEQALQETQRYTRGLIEASLDALVTISDEGRITDVNQATGLITGISRQEIIGTDFSNYFTDPDAARKGYQQVFRDGYVVDYPLEIKHRDGKTTPVLYNASVYKDAQGEVAGVFAAARDITERVRAERELEERRVYLEGVLGATPNAIVTLDENHLIVYWNPGAEILFGYSPEEVIGKNIDHLITNPDTYENATGFTQRVIGGKKVSPTETVRYRKDGSPVDVIVAGSPMLVGDEFIGVVAVYTDITERKRAEEELSVAYDALASSVNGVIIADLEGKIRYANPSFLSMFEYEDEGQVSGKRAAGLFPSEKVQRFSDVAAMIDKVKGETEEFLARRKDGTVFHVEVSSSMVTDQEGNDVGRMASFVDITERVQAQESLHRRNRELALLNRVIAAASTTLELKAVLETTCRELALAFDLPQVSAALLNEARTASIVVAEYLSEGRSSDMDMVIPVGTPATQYVLKHKAPLVVADAQHDPRMAAIHEVMSQRGTVTMLILPLMVRGQVVGTLGLDAPVRHEFSDEEINLAANAAAAAAQALENARLFEEIIASNAELLSIYRAAQQLQQLHTPEILAQEIINTLEHTLGYEYGAVLLIDESTDQLTPFALSDQGRGLAFVEADKAYVTSHGIRLGESITGWVAQNGQSVRLGDVRQDPRYYSMRDDIRSELCVPLQVRNQIIGVVNVESTRLNEYTESDQRLLETVASQIAISIQNSQLLEETQRRLGYLQALHTIDKAISASVDINLTVGVFLDQALTQLEIDAADVLLFDPIMQTLECIDRKGFRTSALEHTHLRLGQGLAGRAALEREMVCIHDLQKEAEAFQDSPELVGEEFVAYYGLPLVAKGVLKGVLEIFHRAPLSADDEWLMFLNALTKQAAIAIDNAIMFTNLQRSNLELSLAYDRTLEGWAQAVTLRDWETGDHARRVTETTLRVARALGIGADKLVHVRRGAVLHDIGKLGIPDGILLKPGPLDEEEWEIMRKHPIYARDLLFPIDYLRPALDIPYSHHEKWDGSGYPQGLR